MLPLQQLKSQMGNSLDDKALANDIAKIQIGSTPDLTNKKYTTEQWPILLNALAAHKGLVYLNLTLTGLSDAHIGLLQMVMIKQKNSLKTLLLCHNQLSAKGIAQLEATKNEHQLSIHIDYLGNPGVKAKTAVNMPNS